MDWTSVPEAPEDGVFKVSRLFNECTIADKVSLGVGAYRDDKGKPLVLEAVIKAKALIASVPPQSWTHEYQAVGGHASFLDASQALLFGQTLHPVISSRTASVQSLSGTGAIRLGCEFVRRFNLKSNVILFPDPTWANHGKIASDAGLTVQSYRYLDKKDPTNPRLDIDGMLEDLMAAEQGSTVMLHMCAHNPTGVDPTLDQWRRIAKLCQQQQLQVFFDNAYQGFASGDLESDAAPLRLFVDHNLSLLVGCSFAKNMGLYGERIGALHILAPDDVTATNVLTQLKLLARAMYSNPPQFGAMVAHRVMTQPDLRKLWEDQLRAMATRIKAMRHALRERLEKECHASDQNQTQQTWHHITDQIGMFSYTGLTEEQVAVCMANGVFMMSTGRISMAGLNEANVDHVAKVIAKSVRETH